jgi:hypothetical protein
MGAAPVTRSQQPVFDPMLYIAQSAEPVKAKPPGVNRAASGAATGWA